MERELSENKNKIWGLEKEIKEQSHNEIEIK